MLEPIKGKPALLLNSARDEISLVIADVHIGFEEELWKRGISLPSQTLRIVQELVSIILEFQPDRLIILGDFKHKIPGTSKREAAEIHSFLRELLPLVKEILIILGNHDGGLRDIISGLKRVKIINSKGMKISNSNYLIGLIHGHAWPSPEIFSADIIVLGHSHPVVEFKDKLGYRYIEPVWVKVPIDSRLITQLYPSKLDSKLVKVKYLLIMPAFNRFLSGNPVNDPSSPKPLLGPLARSNAALLDKAELFLLDGTYLGNIAFLKEFIP